MQAAVSTGCLFPAPTEEAFFQLANIGIDTIEVFVNAPSEQSAAFTKSLREMQQRFHVQIPAVHPYTAPIEGFMLFSRYKRRCEDFLEEAKSVFSMMNTLGAKHYILHGAKNGISSDIGFYCERFAKLAELGKTFGVTVTQENVNKFESGDLPFLREFCRILGDDARLTLDVKQVVRSGMDFKETVDAIGSHIAHVHLSDHGAAGDCLRIGKGDFDIPAFLKHLKSKGFDGAVNIEIYRDAFGTADELHSDYLLLDEMLRNI